jgi:hypothetical protein
VTGEQDPNRDEVGPLTGLLLKEITAEFPEFRIVRKRDSSLARVIHYLLLLLSGGGQRRFLSDYHTVIASTLMVADRWQTMNDTERVILLRHERVHLRQRRRYTFLGMAFLYLIPWFPIGLAYGRARLEWEAYVETLRATAEHLGLSAARSPSLRAHILRRFTGPDYIWMWPFPGQLGVWYDSALAELEREFEAGTHPGQPRH